MSTTLTAAELARHEAVADLISVVLGGVSMFFGTWLHQRSEPVGTLILIAGAALLVSHTQGP